MEIRTLPELAAEAARFVALLTPLAGGATLVTLSGELGAGKTTFVQAAARALGITDSVTSPTFVLLKIYQLPADAPFKRLVHIDAYRLEEAADLTPLGFDGLMRNPENLIMLEWPEHVGLVDAQAAITLTPHDGGSRTLTYTPAYG